MSNFAEVMANNPPRLVVQFRRHDGGDQFQWGIVGHMPVLSLIGNITKIQRDLCVGEWIPGCDQPVLVIAYDPTDGNFWQFVSSDISAESLVGMLEVIKAMLVNSRMAQHAGANQVTNQRSILGPDSN